MALSPTLVNKLSLINPNSYEVGKKNLILSEPMEDKEKGIQRPAVVKVSLKGSYICIKKIETKNKNTAMFFTHQSCADFFIFEFMDSTSNVKLHILEFKTTASSSYWPVKIMNQFMGAYIHALAIAGYLNINIVNTDVYTCFRKDSLSTNLSGIRVASGSSSQQSGANNAIDIDKWLGNKSIIIFDKDDKPKELYHKRIPVDVNFRATISI